MFFKNITAFKLTNEFTLSKDELAEKLAAFKAVEPMGQVAYSEGFAPVIDDELVILVNHCMMICVQRFDKVLPSSVVNDEVDKRVEAIKEEDGRNVSRKEKSEIKDNILIEFLPRAFVRQSKTFAYIDVKEGLLIVNTASQSKAEDVLSLLRKALEGFPALPIQTEQDPSYEMTEWVRLKKMVINATFAIQNEECRMVDSLEKSKIINAKNIDVKSDTIAENVIAHSMKVRSISLIHKNMMSFVLNHNLGIKRLSFEDAVMDERNAIETSTEMESFLADMIILTGSVRILLNDLIAAFGGYREK